MKYRLESDLITCKAGFLGFDNADSVAKKIKELEANGCKWWTVEEVFKHPLYKEQPTRKMISKNFYGEGISINEGVNIPKVLEKLK